MTEWYLDNCSVEDSTTGMRVKASLINFNTEKGKELMYNNWECSYEGSTWEFNFNTCAWVTLEGEKTLIEARSIGFLSM